MALRAMECVHGLGLTLIVLLCSLSTGGIEMYNADGKIKVSNTLESRLDLIAQQVEHVLCLCVVSEIK